MDKASIVQAFDSAAILLVAVGSDGKIGYVSRSAELMFGPILGMDLSAPPATEDPRSPLAALVAAFGTEDGASHAETAPRMVRAKNSGKPMYLWLQILPLGAGGAEGRLILFSDLTDFVSGSEPVRALVSQLAHDLRSPLTSISGAAELLLSGRVGELVGAQGRLVKIVDEGTQKLAAIIKGAYEEGGREEGGASR
ncbi:MAG: hypothetical protein HY049_18815 [Acidobacteria bacterium]|nr:hypothetical protein [Acidobacteriota bacterium]